MWSALEAYDKYKQDPDFRCYIAYISTKPITRPHINGVAKPYPEPKSLREYEDEYGEIIMSVVVLTRNDTPTITHLGIFRNPLFEARNEDKFSNLSMRLHGFSTFVQFEVLFASKKLIFGVDQFMTTEPVKSMSNIFVEAMPEKSVHLWFIGQENNSAPALLAKHPPILKRGADKLITIVRDSKPIYVGVKGRPFDCSDKQYTLGSDRVVADLPVLAKHWTLEDPSAILR